MIRKMAVLFVLCLGSVAFAAEPSVLLSVDIGTMQNPTLMLKSLSANEAVLVIRADGGRTQEVRISLDQGRVFVVVEAPTGPDPFPPDDPDDPDVPDPPDVPEGHLGFTRAAFDWATDIVGLSGDPDRALHAHQMVENWDSVAAGLAMIPPKYATVALGFDALRDLNWKVLPKGPVRDEWQKFIGRFQEKIKPLWGDGGFSRAEAAKILEAVADGLEAVK